jgi:hypothetical protein
MSSDHLAMASAKGEDEPDNALIHSGNYMGHLFLTFINSAFCTQNVRRDLVWFPE